MNSLWFTIIALLLITVSAGLLYLYLTCRKKETHKIKDFFEVTYDKKYLVFSAAILVVSVLTYLYSFFVMDATFLKAFMNAEVALWLLVLGFIDLKEKIIPNKLIVSGIIFWAVLSLVEIFIAHTSWQQVLFFSLIGAGVCGGILFVIALIVKSALGMGDVKMFFVIGLLYGLTNTYSILLFSILVMAVISIILLIAKKVTRKTAIPMAPFVAFGFLLNVLMGM